MRIELSDDARDFLRRDWTELAERDPSATFFHTPAYLKLYWEELGEGSLLLGFAEEDGRTVGAVALELIGETLRFLGGTEVTDYMGPVALPGAEDRVAKELAVALAGLEGWSVADLQGLPEDSPWLPRLIDAAAAEGLAVRVGEDSVAPFLPLPGSYDAYLDALPGKLRHEIRRKARRLEAEAGEYRVVRTTRGSLTEDFDCFVELHRSSEGPKGKFMQPGMEIFFRRLGDAFIDEEVFRLAFIEVDGTKVAGAIGFHFGPTFSLYNSAYDREWSRLSPGMVLVAELIREAADAGCTGFDMLKGDLDYKYRFGARPREIKKLEASRTYS